MRLIAIVLTILLFSSIAHARDFVIALTPNQSPDHALKQVQNSLRFVTALEGSDRVTFLDSSNLTTLAIFTVPEGKNYTHLKARLTYNKNAVSALFRFAKLANGNTNTVRLPQLLRMVGERFSPSEPLEVLVFGSPFYDDPKDADYSMAGGLVPSDAHILASRKDTPYGTKENKDTLSNIRLHLIFESEDVFRSDQHRYFIKRFWALYLKTQGGAVSTFTADHSAAFQRMRDGATTPTFPYKLDDSSKLEMIRLRFTKPETSIYERPISTKPLPQQNIKKAHSVQLGLIWDCAKCDLDLLARSNAGAAIIYFGNNETPEGIHIKDFLTSPEQTNGYETIEFKVPIDLRRLQVVVNFYGGITIKPIRGELRLSVDGQTYSAPFTITAKLGNAGSDLNSVFQTGNNTKYSFFIHPLRVIQGA